MKLKVILVYNIPQKAYECREGAVLTIELDFTKEIKKPVGERLAELLSLVVEDTILHETIINGYIEKKFDKKNWKSLSPKEKVMTFLHFRKTIRSKQHQAEFIEERKRHRKKTDINQKKVVDKQEKK